jgi:drug/metabolite transporter (DMT)-like permease
VRSDLAALGAVILWGSLAALGASLNHIPPLLLTGIGLLIGSLVSLPLAKFEIKKLKVSKKALLVGVLGLFGYHAALFAGLQNAPSVQANLVNYLWPLLIVVLAPLIIPGTSLTLRHVIAAIVGFAGAGIAILSGAELVGGFAIGYVFAFMAAIFWATYSLLSKRVQFRTTAVGTFGFVSGILAIAAHFLFEPATTIQASDWLLLIAMGLGPLGASFYLWDYALKTGNPQRVGLIAFLTPLISTTLLLVVTSTPLSPLLALSAVMIFTAAFVGSRTKKQVNNKTHGS